MRYVYVHMNTLVTMMMHFMVTIAMHLWILWQCFFGYYDLIIFTIGIVCMVAMVMTFDSFFTVSGKRSVFL